MNKIMDILKRIKISNILGVFIFIILLPITLIVKGINKLKGKEIWLISEEKDKARDNGYHFFKYLMNKDTKYNVYYAIDKNCNDYKKIKRKCIRKINNLNSFISKSDDLIFPQNLNIR